MSGSAGCLYEAVRDTLGPVPFADFRAMESALAQLACLPARHRAVLFSLFCHHCGSDDPRCQCWNDE